MKYQVYKCSRCRKWKVSFGDAESYWASGIVGEFRSWREAIDFVVVPRVEV